MKTLQEWKFNFRTEGEHIYITARMLVPPGWAEPPVNLINTPVSNITFLPYKDEDKLNATSSEIAAFIKKELNFIKDILDGKKDGS